MTGTLPTGVTFTRASTATYFDNTGTMRNATVNLALQSADLSNAVWGTTGITTAAPTVTGNATVAPDGTTTAARIVYPAVPAAGNVSSVNQPIAAAAAVYTFSVWLRGAVGGESLYIYCTPDASTFYRTACTLTTSWQRFTLTTSTITTAYWYYEIGTDLRDPSQAATAAQTIYAWGAQLEIGSTATGYVPTTTAANGAPRFDYNPSTLAARGLLIEEARTNGMTQSGDMSNAAWTKASAGVAAPVVTGGQITAPDGTLSGARVVLPAISTASTVSAFFQAFTATAVAYTGSIWLRGSVGGEQTYLYLITGSTYATRQRVTLTTAWQRFSITATLTAANYSLNVGTDLRDASQTSTPAVTIYAWGAQVEQGAFVTSYVPTTSAVVTRAADIATVASIPGRHATAETFNAEFLLLTSQHAGCCIVGDAATANYQMIYLGAGLNAGAWDGAGVNTANSLTLGAVAKAASAWASPNPGSICLNAGTVASSTALTHGYSAVATVELMGNTNATVYQTNGYIRRFRYWPRVLSNTEMQQVTT